MSTLADHLFESLLDNIDLDETGVKHMFQHAMKNKFGSNTDKTDERSERYGTPDVIQPAHMPSRFSDDGPERKKRKIVDPSKREDTCFARGANLIQYKTRKNRQRRRETSRSFPLLAEHQVRKQCKCPR